MVKISIKIPSFHPSIVGSILEAGSNPVTVLEAVNEMLDEQTGDKSKAEFSGEVKSKESSKTVSISASGKMKGVSFSKDCAAGLLARVNWYLEGSREIYTRIGSIQLPNSVLTWVKSDRFKMTAEEQAAFDAKLAEVREKAKAKA